MYFTTEIKINNLSNFDILDMDYLLDGITKIRPPDFDLHVAIDILEREHLPTELLEMIRKWAWENKMVVKR